MKISDYIVKEIYKNGTDKIFGYIGGMITHLVDSIYQNKDVEMINTITEQGAGFCAEGYARTTRKLGVAIATSGPGATNLITPIGNCFFDSTPVLFITGQVNTYEYRKYPNIRQCGFQETNIVDIVKPITKYAKMVSKAEDIKYELEKAMNIALSGRKGPVLLDIPMDIQRTEIDIEKLKGLEPEKNVDNQYLNNIKTIFEKMKRPLVLVGNGVRLSCATEELKEFLLKTKVPVVESLLGIDSVLSNYEYNLGMIGTYGNRYSNLALANADLLLVLGSRLDLRQIGANHQIFDKKTIIQIDIDENELECDNVTKIRIKSDIKEFLQKLNKENISLNLGVWYKKIIELRKKYPIGKKLNNTDNIPNKIMSMIFEKLKENDIITVDVGQNQMWAGQTAKIKNGQRLLFSGGHGCMGFALPCGIGASLTGNRAIIITGDGGMQMNIQELEVIKRRNLPIKIIVMNNQNLAMVRQFQELYFDGRCPSTVKDYTAPDFSKVAEAYGIKATKIFEKDINERIIDEFLNNDKPALLDIVLEKQTQVEPKLLFGNSIENMHPLLSEEEFKENMVSEND